MVVSMILLPMVLAACRPEISAPSADQLEKDFVQPPADAGPAPSRRGPSHLGDLLPSPGSEIGTDGIGIAGNNARHMTGE